MNRSELEEMIIQEIQEALKEFESLDEKYTSAGTVPRIIGRKMTPAQIAKREDLGEKIFSVLRGSSGGKKEQNKLKNAFIRWAASHDRDANDEQVMNSFVWAMASDWAIKGKEFPPAPSQKTVEKRKKEKASAEKAAYRSAATRKGNETRKKRAAEKAAAEKAASSSPAAGKDSEPRKKKAAAPEKKPRSKLTPAQRGAVTKGLGKDLEKIAKIPGGIKTAKEKKAAKKKSSASEKNPKIAKESLQLRELIQQIHNGESK